MKKCQPYACRLTLLVILFLGSFAQAACKNILSPSRDVILIVSGSGTADLTMAVGDFDSQRSDVALPFQTGAFSAKKGDFVYISAQKNGSTGCVSVEIRVDGKSFGGNTSCGAFVIATASGTLE